MTTEDVRRKIREHRVPFDVCFVLDNSYSLHADRFVEKAKGLVFELLEDAARHGDRVSLVAFKSGVAEATVALRPTGSARIAAASLREIPLSGRTPLPGALVLARRLLRQQQAKRPHSRPVVVVVTDGLPNVPLTRGGDAVAETLAQGRALRRAGIEVVVVAADEPGAERRESCARALAEAAGGAYLPFADVSPDAFSALLEGS